MSQKTVLNEKYEGLVESYPMNVEIHETDGKKYASFGSFVPIHCCTPDQVSELSKTTHHYCDIFTHHLLAPLPELAYVRIDDNYVEKVFINRNKRILLTSSDGRLAQWRCAPTFESANLYMAGTPIITVSGSLVSIVTAKRGNHYAVSNVDGFGGYFDTPLPWKVVPSPETHSVYGDRSFSSRDELREYVAALPAAQVSPAQPPAPVLHAARARLALVAEGGRQLSHTCLDGVLTTDIEYL